ncbi:MAG: MarR family transcriptional regulator [Gammaproteobacteria bacterium]|jgi:MarR family transcriptional regulator, temperature-dependent positive regulator of motility|nr:MarR family transcriptional regulator [Gammaproteobacteria bacterium]
MTKYDMQRSPGPLIRRFHQIGLSILAGEFKDLDVTPLQFSIMWVLNLHSGIDQITLARYVALDRTTCSNIVTLLEKKGQLTRKVDPANKRAKLVSLSAKGKKILAKAQAPMERTQIKMLEPLTIEEKKVFLACLQKLVDSGNELSRAPMRYMGH